MGSMLARGLLNAGLNVVVWNRTPSKVCAFSGLFAFCELFLVFLVFVLGYFGFILGYFGFYLCFFVVVLFRDFFFLLLVLS